MQRSFALVSMFLLAAPLAFAQVTAPPPPPPPPDAGPGGPPGISARHNGPDRGLRGAVDRPGREGRMHEDGGPDGLAGMHVPPGTWWRNPEVVSQIGLSPDQVKRIDSIFLESRVQLIHMHASLEEEQLRLEPLLSANPFNEHAAEAQISKIADTRADLEKANARMLLSIRGVLSADQWTKLQAPPVRPARMGGPAPGTGPRRPMEPNAPPAPPAQ